MLVKDPLFSREASKDYIDKHKKNSKKRLMKYTAQTPDLAKKETEYTKQSNYHICGGKHDMDNWTIFRKQTDEERRHWQKKKLCYGYYILITVDHKCQNLQ